MDIDATGSSSSASSSSGASSSSSGSDEDDSDSDSEPKAAAAKPGPSKPLKTKREAYRHPTLSPTPLPIALPSFLALPPGKTPSEAEDDRRARFKRVYMDHLVQGFGSDLEKLRAVNSFGEVWHERS